GVELRLQIDEHWSPRREFLFGDGLLKLGVAFVHFSIERSGVEFLARHSELVNKGKFKTAQAFDRGIASAFVESRGATTRDDDCGSAEESVSHNEILRGIRFHKTPL